MTTSPSCARGTHTILVLPGCRRSPTSSILSPRKHILDHRGPYKGVLRYHLGLIVPAPNEKCRIRVGQEWRHWAEGSSIVLDDTYDHEVCNDTDGTRVVLFLDVVRPLTGFAEKLNTFLLWVIAHSPLVSDARKRQQQWTANVNARRVTQNV